MTQPQFMEMERTFPPSSPEHEKYASVGDASPHDEAVQLSEAGPPGPPRPVSGFKVRHALRAHENRRTRKDGLTSNNSGS